MPILVLSAPALQGGKRANTADTYDFLRRIEEKGLIQNPTKNILFATAGMYRYAQYFDAVREISLKTGVDIEIVGFAAAYSGKKFKASQFLQELKSAADAALRLRNAM
jgi:6-phosphogluconate dehydrogenase